MLRRPFERIADEIDYLEAEALFRALGPIVHGREFAKLVLREASDSAGETERSVA
jgi:hypothetical protein